VTQQSQKSLQTVSLIVGVFLTTMLMGVGGTVLYQNRNAVNLISKGGLSDEEIEVLKDPKAANKKYYDKMNKELWQQYQAQQPPQQPQSGWQPQGGWDRNFKK
jgi:hypothetical protein